MLRDERGLRSDRTPNASSRDPYPASRISPPASRLPHPADKLPPGLSLACPESRRTGRMGDGSGREWVASAAWITKPRQQMNRDSRTSNGPVVLLHTYKFVNDDGNELAFNRCRSR